MAKDVPKPFRWADAMRTRTSPFEKSRALELRYVATLRKVAPEIQRLVDGYPDVMEDPAQVTALQYALDRYAELLGPWAQTVGARMVAESDRQDAAAWNKASRTMSAALRAEIATAPTGVAMRESIARQVVYIKSLPIEAGLRVHKLTQEAILTGRRAQDIAAEIARSGQVSASRAKLIARTEVARTSSELTQARARAVGSDGYVWETSRDADVRPSHRAMQGRFVSWDSPPTLDGLVGHAGCLPNCRCWPRPLIPGMGH